MSVSELVLDVMEKLVRADVNRLVIVDDDNRVEGIITCSDMIDFLVLRHPLLEDDCPIQRNVRAKPRSRQVSKEMRPEASKEVISKHDEVSDASDSVYSSWSGATNSAPPSPDSPAPPVWFDVVC